MNFIQLLPLCMILSSSGLFSQEEERSAHLVLKVCTEKGEVFQGNILLIANKDTVQLTAS